MPTPAAETDEVDNAGDVLDITIPPTMPEVNDLEEAWRRRMSLHEPTFEARRDAAWFHTCITVALVGMLIIWTVTHGVAPGLDAEVGIAFLILHFGAWITGWLALDASTDAWKLHTVELEKFGTVNREGLDHQHRAALAMGVLAAGCLLANTAMVVSALLAG